MFELIEVMNGISEYLIFGGGMLSESARGRSRPAHLTQPDKQP